MSTGVFDLPLSSTVSSERLSPSQASV